MCRYLAQARYNFAAISNNQTFSVMEKKTEKRKHFLHCNIAGFTYWDGCMALSQLEVGTPLEMVRDEEKNMILMQSHSTSRITSSAISLLMRMKTSANFLTWDTAISSRYT